MKTRLTIPLCAVALCLPLAVAQGATVPHRSTKNQSASWWPHISSLQPTQFTLELGPDLGRDSTLHGNADNPASIKLVVLGYHFRRGARVRWDGQPLNTKFVSSLRLEATIPLAKMETTTFKEPNQAAITVANPGTSGHISCPVPFTVEHWALGG